MTTAAAATEARAASSRLKLDHAGEIAHDANTTLALPSVPTTTPEPDASAAAPAAAAEPARGTEAVLVIEDDPQVRSIVRRILTQLGYRVSVAANGAEAAEVAGAHDGPIALILTDVILPGATGPEVVERLRGTATAGAARALYMSGYAGHEVAGEHVAPGHFIQKPFPPAELARCVRQVLNAPAADGR